MTTARVTSPKPALFGLTHANRNFASKDAWGKNKFNSSFPASLACYMHARQIKPIYMTLNEQGKLVKGYIDVPTLFKADPLGDEIFYSFETEYAPYNQLVVAPVPRIDLVTTRRSDTLNLRGLEIKLTALPDNSTHHLSDDQYGCELVVRPDTIVYLALSIALVFKENRQELAALLRANPIDIVDWGDTDEILPLIPRMASALQQVMRYNTDLQEPLVMQPIWKTEGKSANLHQDAYDIFVWSNFAFTEMFFRVTQNEIRRVTRAARSIVWLMKMLLDFADDGQINHERVTYELSHSTRTDKAFSVPGTITHPLMASDELQTPRIKREETRNIILNGGHLLLSPERRLDAVLLSTPNLFE